jgi:competence protein ComEC
MKRKLKNVLAILTILLILGSLTACSQADPPSQGTTPNDISPGIETPIEPAESMGDAEVPQDVPGSSDEPVSTPSENSTFQIHFIDVGQADAALISCDGHHMLIDGGNREDSSRIYTILQKADIDHLDLVVGSHAHEDHIGGISAAFQAADVDLVLSPVMECDSKVFKTFKSKAEEQGGGLTVPSVGSTYELGSATVKILGLNGGEDTNDTSIILKVTYGETSFLFTGDAEYDGEHAVLDSGADLSATVLKVGHHGSDTSTCYSFLRAVTPQYAVISVGAGNSYGHPNDDTLSKLRDAGVEVFRTDLQGDIFCTSDGKTVSFETQKQASEEQVNPTIADGSGQESQDTFGTYIGNVNSMKFHQTSCSSLPKESNRIYFDSRSAAVDAGYVPCQHCTP